jgi:hypothetical protein
MGLGLVPGEDLVDLAILPRTKTARLTLSLGAIANLLSVHKFVNPIKVARSCLPDQIRFDQLLVIQAKAQMSAAHAAVQVLREADAIVGREVTGLDLTHCGFDQPAEFLTLFF